MTAKAPAEKSRTRAAWPVWAALVLVLGFYAWIAATGRAYWARPNPADNNYNVLVRGLRQGHLSLDEAVPPGLARLPDPYDPAANSVYRQPPYWLHDQSYYGGRLYLYFGISPALLLFWPWKALTGHYLLHRQAVALFCGVGFLAAAGILLRLRRRFFPMVGSGVAAAAVLTAGVASGVPLMLQRAEMWEVAVACAHALILLALAAVWQAILQPSRRARWLAAASAALGLAIGARPAVLFAAAILLVPLVLTARGAGGSNRRGLPGQLAAALAPLLLCGVGLMVYNHLRFGNPFEFGERYQLASDRQDTARHFSPTYLWYNFRVYFLEPARVFLHRPFFAERASPVAPAGHGLVEEFAFGALTNLPILWLAGAAPLAWRGRAANQAQPLRAGAAAIGWVFATSALVICLFFWSCCRYEVEFLPELALLAGLGLFGVERALAERPGARAAARTGWTLLLLWSAAFSVGGGLAYRAQELNQIGQGLAQTGQVPAGIAALQAALRLDPTLAAAHDNLGTAFLLAGRLPEAAQSYRAALSLQPNLPLADFNLGNALTLLGQTDAAIASYREAVRLSPGNAQAHGGLGFALAKNGQPEEAVTEYRTALRLSPDFAEGHYNLGNALAQLGQRDEALAQFQEAARLRPDFAEGHYSLGEILTLLHRPTEAAAQYREALRLKPELARVQDLTARLKY